MRSRLPSHVINGISVALGIVVTQAVVHAAAGAHAAALALTGAICASLADVPLRPERAVRRVAAAGVMALAAAATILSLQAHPALTGLGIVAIVFVATMSLGWGPRAGPVSFAPLLALVFTMGLPHGDALHEVLLAQAGGATVYLLWAAVASRVLQPIYRRRAIAAALEGSARLLQARTAVLQAGSAPDDAALRAWIGGEAQLAERLQSARDLVFAATPTPQTARDTAVLLRLIDLRDLMFASSLDFDRFGTDPIGLLLRERSIERLRRLAAALDAARAALLGSDMPAAPLDEPTLPQDADFAPDDPRRALLPAVERRLQRLAGEVDRIHAVLRGAEDPPLLTPDELRQFVAPEGWPLKALQPHASLGSPVLRHALRASQAMGAAYAVALALPWASHPQWLVLSVAVVLRNTFDQTVSRRNLRVAGTVLGCLLVLGLSHVPWPMVLSIAFVVAIGVAHGFVLERYVLTAMAGTVMALLQAHLVAPGGGFPIAERVADTVIGAALAWAFSYVLPSWERRILPTAIGRLRDALRDYARHVLQRGEANGVQQRLDRRRAYDALGALSASLQRTAAEPAGVRPPLAPLTILIDQAQRLMAHLSMVRLLLQREGLRVDEDDAAAAPWTPAAVARTVDAALAATGPADAADAAAVAAGAESQPVAPEPPPDQALRPWLRWRLQLTERDAIAVGQAAKAALAALRPPR